MIIVKQDGVFKVAQDFVSAVSLPNGQKCYQCCVHNFDWLVAADSVDHAQKQIVAALASEGIKSTGAGSFQLAWPTQPIFSTDKLKPEQALPPNFPKSIRAY